MFSDMWDTPALRRNTLPTEQLRVLVVHVPKTGGTSLRLMLEKHVEPESVFISTGHQWTRQSVRSLQDTKLFVGHNFLEPLYMFPYSGWISALALRDPVEWWRSYYKYLRRPDRVGRATENPALGVSFDEFVAGRSDRYLSNPQTAWILMRVRVGPGACTTAPSLVSTALQPGSQNPREILFSLLERVTALGTTDDLGYIYTAVCRQMNWEPRYDRPLQENRSHEEGPHLTLSRQQAHRLAGLTTLDREAYEFARSKVLST